MSFEDICFLKIILKEIRNIIEKLRKFAESTYQNIN